MSNLPLTGGESGYSRLDDSSHSKPLGSEILYQNKPIGRLWCKGYSAKTTEGYLAAEYGEPGSNLGYPKGVKVWSSASHQWATLDIPWVSAIIGWTDDSEQGRSPAD